MLYIKKKKKTKLQIYLEVDIFSSFFSFFFFLNLNHTWWNGRTSGTNFLYQREVWKTVVNILQLSYELLKMHFFTSSAGEHTLVLIWLAGDAGFIKLKHSILFFNLSIGQCLHLFPCSYTSQDWYIYRDLFQFWKLNVACIFKLARSRISSWYLGEKITP